MISAPSMAGRSLASTVDSWLRIGGIKTALVVIDLALPDLNLGVLEHLPNVAARDALAMAKRHGASHLLLAGQLHLEAAGAFCVILHTDLDAEETFEAIRRATAMAFDRMTEAGASASMAFLALPEPLQSRVLAAVASMSATTGPMQ